MPRLTQREDALLGTRLLLVATSTPDSAVSLQLIQALTQGDRLHDPRVFVSTMCEGRDPLCHRLEVGLNLEIKVQLLNHARAELDHLLELPGGVDVHHLEGDRGRREGLASEVEQDGGVLADRVEQNGPAEGAGNLSVDVNGLRLEGVEHIVIGDRRGGSGGHSHLPGSPQGAGWENLHATCGRVRRGNRLRPHSRRP